MSLPRPSSIATSWLPKIQFPLSQRPAPRYVIMEALPFRNPEACSLWEANYVFPYGGTSLVQEHLPSASALVLPQNTASPVALQREHLHFCVSYYLAINGSTLASFLCGAGDVTSVDFHFHFRFETSRACATPATSNCTSSVRVQRLGPTSSDPAPVSLDVCFMAWSS